MGTYLLWVDLETTGLDLVDDEILEACFILTDSDLNTQWQAHTTFQPSKKGWDRLTSNEFVRNMHADNGLIGDLVKKWGRPVGPSFMEFENSLLNKLNPLVGSTIHLAGSGVAAFDRPLINRDFPRVAKMLHYAPIDVGVLKRCWQMWIGSDITDDNAAKTHRAMSDVEGHLREARAFRHAFRSDGA